MEETSKTYKKRPNLYIIKIQNCHFSNPFGFDFKFKSFDHFEYNGHLIHQNLI